MAKTLVPSLSDVYFAASTIVSMKSTQRVTGQPPRRFRCLAALEIVLCLRSAVVWGTHFVRARFAVGKFAEQ